MNMYKTSTTTVFSIHKIALCSQTIERSFEKQKPSRPALCPHIVLPYCCRAEHETDRQDVPFLSICSYYSKNAAFSKKNRAFFSNLRPAWFENPAGLLRCKNFQAISKHSNPQGVSLPADNRGEKKISPFIHAAKFPNRIEASQLARDAYAHRQLRGNRAAIGSGGKKARPFWRRKKASSERAR